jgi:hypothetical protein
MYCNDKDKAKRYHNYNIIIYIILQLIHLFIFFFVFCNIFVTGFPCEIRATLPGESTAATVSRLPRTFDGGGNQSARRKPPVRDPRRKSLLYGATYLVPQAGIEPTPRTDIGYRPVSQTR